MTAKKKVKNPVKAKAGKPDPDIGVRIAGRSKQRGIVTAKKKAKKTVKAKAAKTKTTKMKAGEGKAELHQWTAGDYDELAKGRDRTIHAGTLQRVKTGKSSQDARATRSAAQSAVAVRVIEGFSSE